MSFGLGRWGRCSRICWGEYFCGERDFLDLFLVEGCWLRGEMVGWRHGCSAEHHCDGL